MCGIDQASITRSARGAINRAVRELKEVNATPEQIRERAEVYRLRFFGATLTATALARRWADCDPATYAGAGLAQPVSQWEHDQARRQMVNDRHDIALEDRIAHDEAMAAAAQRRRDRQLPGGAR